MAALARYRRTARRAAGQAGGVRVDRARGAAAIRAARRAGGCTSRPTRSPRCSRPTAFRSRRRAWCRGPRRRSPPAQELGLPGRAQARLDAHLAQSESAGSSSTCATPDEVGAAYRDLAGRFRRADRACDPVQRLVTGGREVILGMRRDAQFGPLADVRPGRRVVEVLRDVASACTR